MMIYQPVTPFPPILNFLRFLQGENRKIKIELYLDEVLFRLNSSCAALHHCTEI